MNLAIRLMILAVAHVLAPYFSQQVGELRKEHIDKHGLPPLSELDSIVREIWSLPEREFQKEQWPTFVNVS